MAYKFKLVKYNKCANEDQQIPNITAIIEAEQQRIEGKIQQ